MNKFKHEQIYRGEDLLDKLKLVKVTICGIGALGSNLADNLARQGFSSLKVIDKDRVEDHNISTQLYGENDVGALKVDALRNKLFRNIGTEIETIGKELTSSNVNKLLKGSNLVIDAFDNSSSRQLVQDECRKIPCLHCGLFEDYGEVIWNDHYKTPKDQPGDICDYPLARNIVMLTVIVATEEVLDFCLNKPRQKSWSITLKDLKIQEIL